MNELFNLIIKLTFLQGFIYSLLFINNKKQNISYVLLGFYLLTSVGPYLGRILLELSPNLRYFPSNFFFLAPVLFYLYSRSVLGVLKKSNYLHLSPGGIEILINCIIFIYPDEVGNVYFDQQRNPFLLIIYVYIIPIYCIFYAIQPILLIRSNKTTIPKLYSIDELSRLNWIKITCCILIIANIFEAVTSLMVLQTQFALYAYLFSTIMGAFICYWVSICGLTQRNLFLSLVINDAEVASENVAQNVSTQVKETVQFDEKLEEQFQRILLFFNETKIFKDKEINLFSVSDLLQMSYRDVSRLINNYGNKNFSQFVNEFRIEEAKKLIEADNLNKYNLSGIAEEVGFNSRSTFFAAFKSITGMTPIEYKNSEKPESQVV